MKTQSKTRTIEIEGMNSDACIREVKDAINSVDGVSTESIRKGSATIECRNQQQFEQACMAVESAGYRTKESGSGKQAGSEYSSDVQRTERAGSSQGDTDAQRAGSTRD
jgi:copper chaperone CopZ